MPLPLNPYIAGDPVGNSPAFVGRDDVLRDVLRVLRNPNQNAITLFGQRRIGKTSMLQHLKKRLPDEGPYLSVYFDLQDKAAWPLPRLLAELARAIAADLGWPLPTLSMQDTEPFRLWMKSRLDALDGETSLALLFDEFDVLADPQSGTAAKDFFPYLRDLLSLNPLRLQFVFVLGRNLTDLSSLALSVFKGIDSKRVSLLTRADTAKLVRLSEQNETLYWPEKAIEAVYDLTRGHAYLTQALCSQVWEAAYDEDPDSAPKVTPQMVTDAIEATLDSSRNMLEWLWNGLGPAEKVVSAALAGAGPVVVDETRLEHILRESGVRILIRELQNAPQLLADWDILEPAEGGHVFRVELLRRWLARYQPLSRTQTELDRILPAADSLFQAAEAFYAQGNLERAEDLLEQAIGINPNHLRANEMLAEILIGGGRLAEAREKLEKLLEFAPSVARPRLVQVYLQQAQAAADDASRLALYEKTLGLDSGNPEARAGVEKIKQLEREEMELAFNYIEGRQALQGGEWNRAIELLQKVVLLNPDYTYERKFGAETAAKLLKKATRGLHTRNRLKNFSQGWLWFKSMIFDRVEKIRKLSQVKINIPVNKHPIIHDDVDANLLSDVFFSVPIPLKNFPFITREMIKVHNNLQKGNSVFLTSGPRMGKTSVLEWVNKQSFSTQQVFIVYLFGIDTPEQLWDAITRQTKINPRSKSLNKTSKKHIVLVDEADNILDYATNHGKDSLQDFLSNLKKLRNGGFEFLVTSYFLQDYWAEKMEKIEKSLAFIWGEVFSVNIVLPAWGEADVKEYLLQMICEPRADIDEVAREIYQLTGGIPSLVRRWLDILIEEYEMEDDSQFAKITLDHFYTSIQFLRQDDVIYSVWNSAYHLKIGFAAVVFMHQDDLPSVVLDEVSSIVEKNFEKQIQFLHKIKLVSIRDKKPKIIAQVISNAAMKFIRRDKNLLDDILESIRILNWQDAEFMQKCLDELSIRYSENEGPKNEFNFFQIQAALQRTFGIISLIIIIWGLLYWIGLL